ncbi:MAG: L-aspartate oxidase [Clostridiales bacterium]|nr:L-aspartate oxidase [Clostridiales bacterium]
MKITADIVIVGTGVSGLYCALNLSADKDILLITKAAADENDSFLAQGGICMLRDEADYEPYFEDTMRAGHYENKKESVDIMLRSSQEVIGDLLDYGVDFARNEDGTLKFTKEGAHSSPRICYHEDITGKEITSKLLARVRERSNIKIIEQLRMVDIIEKNGRCVGIAAQYNDGTMVEIDAKFTVLATGGIGGLYHNSTNYPHLTADSIAIAMKHGIELENIGYVQIHPTTLYSSRKGRRFLISESVRGEGAHLLNADMQRFTDELQPRDVVSKAIWRQMEKDNKPYVWLSMAPIPKETILDHFPNIYKRCLEEGYDVTKECIPVVPAQHYFMGGIKVDKYSKTTMDNLYAVGETACNGVHGKNRLASNSLLESLVFAKRAALRIAEEYDDCETLIPEIDIMSYCGCDKDYVKTVRDAIERKQKENE